MIRRLFKLFVRIFWLLPGFLLWASFPPMAEKTDCLFALAPLIWLARRSDAKRSAKVWFLNGLFFWVATLSWMPAIVKNGGPWPLVVLGWGALAAYCAAYFGAFGFLAARYWGWAKAHEGPLGTPRGGSYWRRLAGVLLVEPVLWAGLELVRSRLFGGFSWNQLGVPVVNAGFGSPAAVGGIYLVSTVVIWVNGSIAGIAERMWQPERSGFAALKKFGSLETILVIAIIFGCYNLPSAADLVGPVRSPGPTDAACGPVRSPGPTDAACGPVRSPGPADNQTPQSRIPNPSSQLSVALIQRDFPCVFDRDRKENPAEVYSNLLSRVALLKPELVVLPESALSEVGAIGSPRAAAFADWVSALTGAGSVLAGGCRFTERAEFNSAALYSAGSALQVYDKVHLVPFGEFIPGDKLVPALQKLAPVGSCTPGTLKVLDLPRSASAPIPNPESPIPDPESPIPDPESPIPLGVAICYEDTDSAQMRRLAQMGARLLVFITNDSWFSYSDEAEQHAWQAVARAIETGLPVVRVGNSGVTGTIAPDGEAAWLTAEGRPLVDAAGTMFDRVTLAEPLPPGRWERHPRTWYVLFGDVPLLVVFLLLIGLMILVKYRNDYEKRRTLSL